nr:hypothetical protein CFP56_09978 [Quercus suber]
MRDSTLLSVEQTAAVCSLWSSRANVPRWSCYFCQTQSTQSASFTCLTFSTFLSFFACLVRSSSPFRTHPSACTDRSHFLSTSTAACGRDMERTMSNTAAVAGHKTQQMVHSPLPPLRGHQLTQLLVQFCQTLCSFRPAPLPLGSELGGVRRRAGRHGRLHPPLPHHHSLDVAIAHLQIHEQLRDESVASPATHHETYGMRGPNTTAQNLSVDANSNSGTAEIRSADASPDTHRHTLGVADPALQKVGPPSFGNDVITRLSQQTAPAPSREKPQFTPGQLTAAANFMAGATRGSSKGSKRQRRSSPPRKIREKQTKESIATPIVKHRACDSSGSSKSGYYRAPSMKRTLSMSREENSAKSQPTDVSLPPHLRKAREARQARAEELPNENTSTARPHKRDPTLMASQKTVGFTERSPYENGPLHAEDQSHNDTNLPSKNLVRSSTSLSNSQFAPHQKTPTGSMIIDFGDTGMAECPKRLLRAGTDADIEHLESNHSVRQASSPEYPHARSTTSETDEGEPPCDLVDVCSMGGDSIDEARGDKVKHDDPGHTQSMPRRPTWRSSSYGGSKHDREQRSSQPVIPFESDSIELHKETPKEVPTVRRDNSQKRCEPDDEATTIHSSHGPSRLSLNTNDFAQSVLPSDTDEPHLLADGEDTARCTYSETLIQGINTDGDPSNNIEAPVSELACRPVHGTGGYQHEDLAGLCFDVLESSSAVSTPTPSSTLVSNIRPVERSLERSGLSLSAESVTPDFDTPVQDLCSTAPSANLDEITNLQTVPPDVSQLPVPNMILPVLSPDQGAASPGYRNLTSATAPSQNDLSSSKATFVIDKSPEGRRSQEMIVEPDESNQLLYTDHSEKPSHQGSFDRGIGYRDESRDHARQHKLGNTLVFSAGAIRNSTSGVSDKATEPNTHDAYEVTKTTKTESEREISGATQPEETVVNREKNLPRLLDGKVRRKAKAEAREALRSAWLARESARSQVNACWSLEGIQELERTTISYNDLRTALLKCMPGGQLNEADAKIYPIFAVDELRAPKNRPSTAENHGVERSVSKKAKKNVDSPETAPEDELQSARDSALSTYYLYQEALADLNFPSLASSGRTGKKSNEAHVAAKIDRAEREYRRLRTALQVRYPNDAWLTGGMLPEI